MTAPSLYAAYGSNLWYAQMARRCPGATVAGQALLPGWRLVLRRFALVEPDPAAACPIGLWHVTPGHLAALDRYEGPHCYRRDRLALPAPVAGLGEAWIYHEIIDRPGPPAAEYIRRLRDGYRDFGFDPAPLEAALAAACRVA
ncbi:gamma-glutamylcyclotransferase family protein [Siccirubricoccus sp. G192]|uniref:gamma-glutamylcyclotransferase family protein n=1 Tax=Siccirubricoccus sp. G192 TaxID=2849651 RepID=UPI001C2CC5B8|nr:gamma-glutamylcyclotransferase family protein [Siccirubricoccus sp. G192]MBV1795588.1 gamma-glutamylcyclotransferase [Siccirubricoccus sp. G192]MBV1800263.1 gamma-glutamylcyclotransferase [Siccirubricoccus sp. G192]